MNDIFLLTHTLPLLYMHIHKHHHHYIISGADNSNATIRIKKGSSLSASGIKRRKNESQNDYTMRVKKSQNIKHVRATRAFASVRNSCPWACEKQSKKA